jgi:uncharacterized protein YbjT (DUF2867 family)
MKARGALAVAGATGRVGRHVVDVLEGRGYDVVAMSRSSGVDVVSGDGLADALAGVECVIDTATGVSPEQEAATEFFTAAARNLHTSGGQAGSSRSSWSGAGRAKWATCRRCARSSSRRGRLPRR